MHCSEQGPAGPMLLMSEGRQSSTPPASGGDRGLDLSFFGAVRIVPLKDAQPDRKRCEQKLECLLAHEVGAVCPGCRTDRRDSSEVSSRFEPAYQCPDLTE